MDTVIQGAPLLAVAVKYNSTKTCFFILPEGAAPTTRGLPYFTRFTDGNRNVMTRAVDRPVVASRYFGKFNKVDVSDQRRQHELGLEMKWVVKGEDSGKFRMATTIFGQGVIDTMQTLRGQSHPGHPIRSVTTKDFAESLASEMVDNELDGMVSRPKENKRKRATPCRTTPTRACSARSGRTRARKPRCSCTARCATRRQPPTAPPRGVEG